MPCRQIDPLLDALAVEAGHDETVDRDQRQVVRVEKVFEAGDLVAIGFQVPDKPLRETQFNGKHFIFKCGFLEPEDIAFEAGPKFGQGVVREDV